MGWLEKIRGVFSPSSQRKLESGGRETRDPELQTIMDALASDDPDALVRALNDGRRDYLGEAASKKHAAKAAIKTGRYDEAWSLLHEQKQCIAQHYAEDDTGALSRGSVIAWEAEVHEDLANVLRLEGKHRLAFAHIVYWILASRGRRLKRHDQKLTAYFNRCKYSETSIEDVRMFMREHPRRPDFRVIENRIAEWT